MHRLWARRQPERRQVRANLVTARRHTGCCCENPMNNASASLALAVFALATAFLPAEARAEGPGPLPSQCPGYVAHLQGARVRLARGDRPGAAAELRQAEKALDSCIHSAADGNAVG